jgi:hypothetical protein
MNSGGIEFMYQFGNLQSEEYACPEVSIVIYNPLDDYEGDTQGETVNAIVDTGAEMTVVPQSTINALRRRSINEFETYPIIMENTDGSRRECEAYRLCVRLIESEESESNGQENLQINFIEREIEIVSLPDKEYALIGRDFLDLYKVVFNFKNRLWGFCDETNCQIS